MGPAGPARSVVTGQILAIHNPPFTRKFSNRPPDYRGKPTSTEICIVVGADAPGSDRRGERQVFIFPNVAAAHRAGFTWAT